VVIAHHLDLGPKLPEELDEVVGEAVVVIEDKNPQGAAYGTCTLDDGCLH
jgi:hypothetical protein